MITQFKLRKVQKVEFDSLLLFGPALGLKLIYFSSCLAETSFIKRATLWNWRESHIYIYIICCHGGLKDLQHLIFYKVSSRSKDHTTFMGCYHEGLWSPDGLEMFWCKFIVMGMQFKILVCFINMAPDSPSWSQKIFKVELALKYRSHHLLYKGNTKNLHGGDTIDSIRSPNISNIYDKFTQT